MARRALLTAACAAVLVAAGCGKKGPPLPPIVRVPEAVKQVAARRIGDEVFLTFTLPAQNIDTSIPVALGRVDVYGYTAATAPPAPRFTEVATLVGSVTDLTAVSATLRDELTGDELVAGRPLASLAPAPSPAPPSTSAIALKRFYLIVPFSDRGRPGPPSAVLELPLTTAPDAPGELVAAYSAQAAALSWAPSGGLVGFILDLASPPAAAPLEDVPAPEAGRLPPGPTRYNVYRELEPDRAPVVAVTTAPAAPALPPAPQPLNKSPIEELQYSDPLQTDGRRRCYSVSAVRGSGERAVEGRRSDAVCVVPLDIFSPAPPTGLSPIAIEGAISLVWEANSEPDLAGYLVLRGAPGDGPLVAITDQPVTETRFTDRNVMPGARYAYAVIAVDNASPQPNTSVRSDRVEITAP